MESKIPPSVSHFHPYRRGFVEKDSYHMGQLCPVAVPNSTTSKIIWWRHSGSPSAHSSWQWACTPTGQKRETDKKHLLFFLYQGYHQTLQLSKQGRGKAFLNFCLLGYSGLYTFSLRSEISSIVSWHGGSGQTVGLGGLCGLFQS